MSDVIVTLRPETEEKLRERAAGQPIAAYIEELVERDLSRATNENSEQLQLSCLEHAGVSYQLKNPIQLTVEYADGSWTIQNEALNLWGHGETRDEALRDLQENFAYLVTEFADESDTLLDDKAQRLKIELRKLVAQEVA